jgi:tripartite-type tricarboxylate transporter receptor subunit TctC
LNQAIDRALRKPKVRDAFVKLGAEPAGGSPAVFGALITAQVAHWEKVVKEAGITMPQ